MTRRALSAACLLAACLGCGKTNQDVINEYRPPLEQQRAKLRQLRQQLPQPGAGADRGRLQLDPLPVFDRAGRVFNTEFLADEQLTDPETKPAHDLILSGSLTDCLLWTGPRNPMASSALTQTADAQFRKLFDDALACRYVVVYRAADYRRPVAVTERNYQPGALTLEVSVADLEKAQVLTTFPVSGRSAPVVEYVFREGDDRLAAAERWAESSLMTDVRKQLAAALAERTGGTFRFDP